MNCGMLYYFVVICGDKLEVWGVCELKIYVVL